MTSALAATTESTKQQAARRVRRARRGQWLALLLGLVMVGAVVYLTHPTQAAATISRLGLAAVLEVLALNVPVVGLRAWRADVVLRRLGQVVPVGRMLGVQLVGQTWSSVTPAAGGDFIRAWLWRRDDGVPLSAGAAVVVFERLFSFGLLVALAVLLVAFPRLGTAGWLLVAVGLAAISLAPYLVSRPTPRADRWLHSVVDRLPWVADSGDRFLRGLDQLRGILSSPLVLAQASAATLAIYAISGLQMWVLVDALGHHAPITQMVATYAISQVGGILSTLPFGLGPADLLTVGAMSRYGFDLSLGAVVALLFRLLSTLPMAVAAIPAYLLLGRPDLDQEE